MNREEKIIVIVFMTIFFVLGLIFIFMPMNKGENINMEKITCEHNGFHWVADHCIYK